MQKLELYSHNKTAYQKVEAMLAENGRAAVIHPTGTGKSFIAFALVEAYPDKRFLWLAPSEYIYALQTRKLSEGQGVHFDNIEFHTYAWLMRNENAIENLQPDYIILDEFHRAGAKEWGRCVCRLIGAYPDAKLFGMTATNVRYLDNQRDMADELFEGAVASEMDLCEAMARKILPEPKYVISVYSYEEKLRGYEAQIARLKNKRQREKTERLVEKLRRALQRADGLDLVFEKHMPGSDAKVIIFCANVEHMQEIVEKTDEWFGRIDAEPHIYSVYSDNPDAEKDFRKFVEDDSDHLKLLFCIDMLNEGIHVDDVDAIVLCRPTVSPIVYKQQIGRALAAGSTKSRAVSQEACFADNRMNHTVAHGADCGTVCRINRAAVHPVIFDMVNNFDNLYQIDALREEFEELAQMYGTAGDGMDGDTVGFEVIDELRDCRELMEQIQRNLDAAWDIYYQELCRYTKKNGTAKVPKRYVADDGLYLGRWMQRQKALYNEGKLSEARIRLMEMLGISWDSESDQQFEYWLSLLWRYKDEHGNAAVPTEYETADGEKLGRWCGYMRRRRKVGRITQERIDALDEVGFVWELFILYWEEGYRHAKEYFDEYGNLSMTNQYECGDGFKLGLWLSTQRKVYAQRAFPVNTDEHLSYRFAGNSCGNPSGNVAGNDKENILEYTHCSLTEEKIKRLDAIGMEWERRGNDRFDEYLKAFQKYNEEHDDAIIPACYVDGSGLKLGQWASRMRHQYFAGKLPEGKKARLLEAGFPFDGISTQWRQHYQEAEAFYREHGSLHVPKSYTKAHGGTLDQWIGNQRKEYRKEGHGKLTAEQAKLLEALHIERSDRFEESFERGVEEFQKYVREYHDRLVPSEYATPDGYNLGRWLCRQREKYRDGRLEEAQVRALEDAGMIWEGTESVRAVMHWNEMYETAKRYANDHGSLRGMPYDYTTSDGRKLGGWIVQQRRIRRGTIRHSIVLDREKIGMLDAIGMDWGRNI